MSATRPGLDVGALEARVLLVMELTDGAIRLVSQVPAGEADQIVRDFASMAAMHILGTSRA